MPIYEFYCPDCHTIFKFFSRRVNTSKRPACPQCGRPRLDRRVSAFAVTGRAQEPSAEDDLPIDEARMERALDTLADEAEHIDEDNPKQAADLMRKLTDMTGLELSPKMREALERMEQGEDPDRIEEEFGDVLEEEDPFVLPGKKSGARGRRRPPRRDETLYDL